MYAIHECASRRVNEVMGDNVPHLNSFLPSGIQGFKETLPRMDLCQMGMWFLTHIRYWVCIYIYIVLHIYIVWVIIYIYIAYIYICMYHVYTRILDSSADTWHVIGFWWEVAILVSSFPRVWFLKASLTSPSSRNSRCFSYDRTQVPRDSTNGYPLFVRVFYYKFFIGHHKGHWWWMALVASSKALRVKIDHGFGCQGEVVGFRLLFCFFIGGGFGFAVLVCLLALNIVL